MPKFSILADQLTPGFHMMGLRAQDGEGNWSYENQKGLFVAVELHQAWLPVMQN